MKHKQLNKQIKSRDSMTKVRSGKRPGIGAVCLQLEHTGAGAAVGQAQAGSGDVPFARGVGRRQGEQCVRQRTWEGTCRAGSSEEESREAGRKAEREDVAGNGLIRLGQGTWAYSFRNQGANRSLKGQFEHYQRKKRNTVRCQLRNVKHLKEKSTFSSIYEQRML